MSPSRIVAGQELLHEVQQRLSEEFLASAAQLDTAQLEDEQLDAAADREHRHVCGEREAHQQAIGQSPRRDGIRLA